MLIENHKFNYKYLVKNFDDKHKLGKWIRQYINLHGVLILQNLEAEFHDFNSAKQFFAELSSYIGILVSHNINQNDFVWKIKPGVSKSAITTFSEHNHTAPLHTDSQYRSQPERYMALLTLKQAKCGGGNTQLLDFRQILKMLQSSIKGKKLIEFFSEEKFPIVVPSVFQKDKAVNYIYSSLISEAPLIRYRYDTLKTGLFSTNNRYAQIFQQNLDALNNYIQNSPHKQTFSLCNNEILFVDNHKILHGRTAFVDPERLLLRIRMN